MYHLADVRRVLVITVTSGLGVWEAQVAQHCPIPWTTTQYGTGETKASTFEEWAASATPATNYTPCELRFLIVNFQNVYTREMAGREWVAAPNDKLQRFNADLVVCDESHHIGDPNTVQSVEARRLGRQARFRVFMTGSMFHRKPFYVFGQAKFFDDGAALGSSFAQYKRRISVMGGYGGYEVLRYRNLRWMTRQLKPFVYMEKYVPPRGAVTNLLTFDLQGENLRVYSEMSQGHATWRGYHAMAEIVLTKHLRLQQICGGFLRFNDGHTRPIGLDKLDMCRDRLNEYREQAIDKAVIGCRFLAELAAVGRIARTLGFLPVLFHGGVPKGDERTRRIALFQETSKPALFISQLAAGKESIDLSAADTMMFYSLSESYVEHDQFSNRIVRYGETRTLQYDFLQANGTRDVVTFAALQEKRDVADLIVKDPARVEQLATLENRKRGTQWSTPS
jgi:SNF2-related domain